METFQMTSWLAPKCWNGKQIKTKPEAAKSINNYFFNILDARYWNEFLCGKRDKESIFQRKETLYRCAISFYQMQNQNTKSKSHKIPRLSCTNSLFQPDSSLPSIKKVGAVQASQSRVIDPVDTLGDNFVLPESYFPLSGPPYFSIQMSISIKLLLSIVINDS